jgi:hypothetical protein
LASQVQSSSGSPETPIPPAQVFIRTHHFLPFDLWHGTVEGLRPVGYGEQAFDFLTGKEGFEPHPPAAV